MTGSSGTLLAQYTHIDSLRLAWAHIRRKGGGAAGGDGMDKAEFAKHADAHLRRLAAEIAMDIYQPGPVRIVKIGKKHGGTRTLSIPCLIDRVAQRAVAAGLSRILEPHFEKSSYAYRPGRSVKLASERITGYYARGFSWVYESDIDDYFPNVPHARVLSHLSGFVPDDSLNKILEQWLAMDGDCDYGLPQGAPISPVLANLYLDPLDEAMDQPNWGWVRYADDFVCLANTEEEARAARKRVIEVLAELGLHEKASKTRIATFDGGMRFLGRLFVKSMMMTDRDGLTPDEERALMKDDAQRLDIETGKSGKTAAIGQRTLRGLKRSGAEVLSFAPDKPQDLSDEAPYGPEPDEDAGVRSESRADSDCPVARRHASDEDMAGGIVVPVTRTLYVTKPDHNLTLRGKSLAVEDEHGEVIWLKSVSEVDRIDVGSHARAESPALRRAISAGIAVFFVDGHGQSQGACVPALPRRGHLHLNQARMSIDTQKRLEMARILVAGKIFNQRRLVKKWILLNNDRDKASTAGINEKLHRAAKALQIYWKKVPLAKNLKNILGVEAASTKLYWQAFRDQLRKGGFGARMRRPAPDPVNVVLNWTSWLLARDLRVQIERTGLHSGFGVLHGTRDGYSACVYDLMEEFRAPIAEKLAMSLFNKGPLRDDDFYTHKDDEAVCMMTPDGSRKLIRAYEKFVSRPNLKRPFASGKTHYRGLMRDQIYAYIRHVNGAEIYRPYKMDI